MAIPVTLEDARRQIRLADDDDSQDVDLQQFITDAAAWVEEYTGHILVARDVTETFRVPGRIITLRAWPIKPDAVPVVLDPELAPVAGVILDASRRPARISSSARICWPLNGTDERLTITVRAGYGDADAVPGNFRRAMLILISAYDSDREGGAVFQQAEESARRLCGRLRARKL
jgi:uncharacterized phiE125 gp8 family phage protein